MKSSINDQFSLRDLGLSNAFNSLELPRHRWYFYKEGFSPNLVKQAIDSSDLKEDSIIVDPFNGSGTTTLTSALSGYNSIGVEVNPFTSYLAQTKQISISVEEIRKYRDQILQSVKKGSVSPLLNFSTFSEKSGLDKWLFNSEILNSFEGGWKSTEKLKSANLQKVFRLALIISAMGNCNAKRDGKCFRYRPTWKDKTFNKESFIKSLESTLDIMETDFENSEIQNQSKLINGDARSAIGKIRSQGKFNLCITSPPYLNTFDYTDIYRPELFLGKFVKDNRDLYKLRLATVRSHIQAAWSQPTASDFGHLYQKSLNHLQQNQDLLMSKRIPDMVQAYFEDMKRVLMELRKRAAHNASLWLVVSNSAYAGIEIPVDLILAEVGNKTGWYLREVGVLRYLKKRKTKYSSEVTQLRESVVIFDSKKK